jgi:hypothetical protein
MSIPLLGDRTNVLIGGCGRAFWGDISIRSVILSLKKFY